MANLKSRLNRLECRLLQCADITDGVFVVIVDERTDGQPIPVDGWRFRCPVRGPVETWRAAGESDDDLAERVKHDARMHLAAGAVPCFQSIAR